MGKACQNSCNFGAISMGADHAYIDPNKCKECGKCAQACPYNAIAHLERPCKKVCPVDATTYDEYGICVIDEEKCIQCGACIHSCPFGAIGTKTFMVDIIKLIQAGKRVVAMVAPATEGQFGGNITMGSWKTALKKVGFDDMVEVGLGGDMTAAYEAEEWAEAYKQGKKMTTSCCPAFVNMIQKHFSMLLENMSTTVSPMCAVSRMLKSQDPDVITVFIGPCIAKKSEALDLNIKDNADYVLTFGEVRAMMRAKGVELETYGQGMGALGLPGDASPASRFVRAAFLKWNAKSEKEESANVSQFFHILDGVAMVRGMVMTPEGKCDITTYSSCMNGEKGIYYYKTYENNRIRAVDMHREDLDGTQLKVWEIGGTQDILREN